MVIEIINPVEYASYVEFGHRTANHTGWVPGRFMMTISEQEMQNIAPALLERKINKFMTMAGAEKILNARLSGKCWNRPEAGISSASW